MVERNLNAETLHVLQCAKRLYEEEQRSIMVVFDDAVKETGVDDGARFEAIRAFIINLPDPEGVFHIQSMLVTDLIDGFDRAIRWMEQRSTVG